MNQVEFFIGGWFGFKTLVVSKKIKETSDITSFIIQNPGGEPLPDFKPGLSTNDIASESRIKDIRPT